MSVAVKVPKRSVAEIAAEHPKNRGSLIPVLQEVQAEDGYLSPESLDALAEALELSVNEIYGVATFYTQFRFTPPGKHTICVCQGTACHVRGSKDVLNEFEDQLAVKAGETTEDGEFGLERVACLGCCALAPVVSVDGEVHAGASPKGVAQIIKQTQDQKDGEQ